MYSSKGKLKGLQPGGIKGWETFQSDPFKFSQEILGPALAGKSEAQQKQLMSILFGNRVASFIMQQMTLQGWKFQRDVPLIKGQAGIEGYDKLQATDPKMAWAALSASWGSLRTALFDSQAAIPVLNALSSAMRGLAYGIGDHPDLSRAVSAASIHLGGLGGAILALGAAARSAKWAMGGLGVGAAVAGGGGSAVGAAAAGAAGARAGTLMRLARFGGGAGVLIGGALAAEHLADVGAHKFRQEIDDAHWNINRVLESKFGRSSLWPTLETTMISGRIMGRGLRSTFDLASVEPPTPYYAKTPDSGLVPGGAMRPGGGAIVHERETVGAVSLTGQTTLTGDVHLTIPGFGDIIGRIVAQGMSHAAGGSLTTGGARPDFTGGPVLQPPT
jgi:hypothetical protein